MLFLVFQLEGHRYAIEASQVVEVLPLVHLRQIPCVPVGLAGVFNYHGAPVPVVDLASLALGKPSQKWMSTRIILLNVGEESGSVRLLGLLAERATETVRRTAEDFKNAGVSVAEARYFGPITLDASGMIQRIEIKRLLSDTLRKQLYPEPVDSA